MKKTPSKNMPTHEHTRRVSALPRGRCDLRRLLQRLPRAAILSGVLALIAPVGAFAQANAARPRITAQINESNLTTLRGNTHPLARPQYDQGAVADGQPMRRMLLLLQRSPEQETALRTLIDQQQSKSSPNYHQWLTPQQFGQQFGPATSDIQTVTDWLTSHGFQIARVSTGGTLIEFSGTAGQVSSAFHTQIHRYNVNGEVRYANATDPQIPTALAPVVAGPVSLNNFPKKALVRNLGIFRKTVSTGKVASLYTVPNACTTVNGAGANCNAIGPGDFAKIYNLPANLDGTGQTIAIVGDSEICTKNSPDFAMSCTSDDVAAFRNSFGLPTTSADNFPNVILDGPDPGFNGDEVEGNLDVQWSGAVAKNATIDFVIAEDTEATFGTDLAAEYIVDNNLAPVMSESFGACEPYLGTNGNEFYSALWEQAAAQGITVIVSSGDSGSAGCDDPNYLPPNAAQSGVYVNGIASTAFNVAAGGTDFDITAANYQSTYWGGGNATVNGISDVSATGYIPETTWNDSCAQNFTGVLTGCNTPSTLNSVNIVGGGGGQSNCVALNFAGNSCTEYYGKPSWQAIATGSGLNAGTDIARDLPDIAIFAADGYVSNSFYIICEADLNPNGAACNINTPYFDFTGLGGTSSAAPTFAGMMALVNQNIGPTARQGNANYVLYKLFSNQSSLNCSSTAGPAGGCTFNDVSKGNNSVVCYETSPNCSNATNSGSYGVLESLNSLGALSGTLAFNAGTGFDLATGMGSINASNLVNNWPAAVGAFLPTTTSVCLSTAATSLTTCVPGNINITHGATVWVNIQVNNGQGTAAATSGDAALIGTFPGGTPGCTAPNCTSSAVDHFTSNNYVLSNVDVYPLVNGAISGATTASLVGGTYSVIAHFAGDGTYGGSNSTSPIQVTVAPEASTTTLSSGIFNFSTGGASGATSAYYGDSVLLRADVVGGSGQESATGSVTINDSYNSGAAQSIGSFPLNTEGYTEYQTGSNVDGALTTPLAVGTHSFTASFGGDPSYSSSSTSAAVPLTVLQAPTTTTVTPSVISVPANTAFSIMAFVDTQNNSGLSSGGSSGVPPTGTVTFFAGSTNLGTVNVSSTLDSYYFVAARATLSNVKLTSSATLTATYNPVSDPNYVTSTSPGVAITVTSGVTPGISLSPTAGTVTVPVNAPGQSGTTPITVSATNGFTGAVTLTCLVSPSNLTDPPTCSFSPSATVTLTNTTTSGQQTLNFFTTAASSKTVPFSRPLGPGPSTLLIGEAAAVLTLMLLLALASKKRRGMILFATVVLAVLAVGTSCGSSSSTSGTGGGGGNSGTTVDAYTVTVTATPSGATAQTTTVTFNLQ